MTGDATAPGTDVLEITTRSGAVVLWARPIERAEVLRGPAEIQPDGVVRSMGSSRLEIACPEGTDVIIGSSSGRIECHGPLGRVAVTGRSGRISIDEAELVEVRTSSGAVTIDRCDGACRVAATSGNVDIGTAGSIDVTLSSGRLEVGAVGDVVVRSGSGKVDIGLARSASVDVCSLSGRVSVSVPPDLAPTLQLVSRSGRVEADVESGTDGTVVVETSSGRIRVTRG